MSAMPQARAIATHAKLVAAARELFGARGYEATSIEAVLEHAGAKRGALYHHFASKQALFDAVLEQVVADVATAGMAAARGHADPLESLRAGSASWLRESLDPAVQRIVLIDAPSVVGWTRWRALDDQYTLGGVRASLQALDAAGRLPPGADVDMLANMLLAAVNEAALLIARAADPDRALSHGLAAVDMILDRLVSLPG
jgi:AcrR family transcriptional regulator